MLVFGVFMMHASSLKHVCISVLAVIIAMSGEYHAVSSSVRTPPVQRIPLLGHSMQMLLAMELASEL
jgi:hypothetical protein